MRRRAQSELDALETDTAATDGEVEHVLVHPLLLADSAVEKSISGFIVSNSARFAHLL